jgi:hypothetical protein
MMDFGFLCHYAQQEDGKLYARGIGFDKLNVPGVPCSLDGMFYVLQLRAQPGSPLERPFTLKLVNADGRSEYEMEGQVHFNQQNYAGEPTVRLLIGLEEVIFPRFGPYALVFELDGREVHRAGLEVRLDASASPA